MPTVIRIQRDRKWKRMGLKWTKHSSRGKEVQKCNEFGTVVVQITNRSGNVIAANILKEQQTQILA
jgi:hypothetical protein